MAVKKFPGKRANWSEMAARWKRSGQNVAAFMIGSGLCLRSHNQMAQLANIVNEFRPSLVVIDSLVRVHGADENSATEMSRSLRSIKQLIQQFKVAVVIADHQRKQIGFISDPKSMLRGSSDKSAFVDSLISVSKDKERLCLNHAKARMDEQQKEVMVEMKDDDSKQKVCNRSRLLAA